FSGFNVMICSISWLRCQSLARQGLERRQSLVVIGENLVVLELVLENRAEVRKQREKVHASDPVARDRRLEREGGLGNNGAAVEIEEVLVGPGLQERILQTEVEC